MNGGALIAEVLRRQGVETLFTLCGGHISPILVEAKKKGLRIIDVRHEATAVFAADATARLTGVPGVAAVTAGPGVTNTITAVKNAQLAQSPVVILGGATATVLRNRGALQDIDQLALFAPHVKWATSVGQVRALVPALERAFRVATDGVPGPVFVECPVDLLYDEPVVRGFYGAKSAATIRSATDLAIQSYLRLHLAKVFWRAGNVAFEGRVRGDSPAPREADLQQASALLGRAQRPVLLLGSQALLEVSRTAVLVGAVERLGVPTYLSGMARGLLGRSHPQWLRHKRTEALREADLVLLAGVPCDFRLNYGRHIGAHASLVAINRSERDATLNRKPTVAAVADAGRFLEALAARSGTPRSGTSPWASWLERLRGRDQEREESIDRDASTVLSELVNPVATCRRLDASLGEMSTLVADGGDFVATASYTLAPRGPLRWLDPGVFGTLGVGAGFGIGAAVARPGEEVWIIYGDGSSGYGLVEFDTFVRHGLPIIAVVGNDAGWTQIARDQVTLLGDPVGTALSRTDYHRVVEGFGAKGILVRHQSELDGALAQAKSWARQGHAVLVNVHLAPSEFRKGSMSM
jgi:acetolactate synthase-1/2/3 large subunit